MSLWENGILKDPLINLRDTFFALGRSFALYLIVFFANLYYSEYCNCLDLDPKNLLTCRNDEKHILHVCLLIIFYLSSIQQLKTSKSQDLLYFLGLPKIRQIERRQEKLFSKRIVEKYHKTRAQFYGKINIFSVKLLFLLKKLLKSWFHEIFKRDRVL